MEIRSKGMQLSRPGWPEVAVALLIYLMLLAVIAVMMARISDEYAVLRGNFGMVANGIAGVLALAAAISMRIRSLRKFGFCRVAVTWLFAGAAIGIAAYGISHVMEAVYFTYIAEQNTQADFQAAATDGALSFLILLVSGAILTPFGEEAVFRSVVANALNRYGGWAGVGGSAFIFAAIHGPSVVFLNAFLIGVLTGLLFRKTSSIWPGLVVHVVFNGLWLITYAVA